MAAAAAGSRWISWEEAWDYDGSEGTNATVHEKWGGFKDSFAGISCGLEFILRDFLFIANDKKVLLLANAPIGFLFIKNKLPFPPPLERTEERVCWEWEILVRAT